MGRGSRLKVAEPTRQRDEIRQRLRSRRMQLRDDRTDDPRRLVVASANGEFGQRGFPFGALQKQRVAVVGQHPGRAVPVPPRHQRVAELLLGLHSHLQHGPYAVPSHRQEMAAAGYDRIAVGTSSQRRR
jgi:hypothetical protein